MRSLLLGICALSLVPGCGTALDPNAGRTTVDSDAVPLFVQEACLLSTIPRLRAILFELETSRAEGFTSDEFGDFCEGVFVFGVAEGLDIDDLLAGKACCSAMREAVWGRPSDQPEPLPNVDIPPTDSCPNDPNKFAPGLCGCGTPDADSDGDGVIDCEDDCPLDANKTEEGECGCGIPDSEGCGELLVAPLDAVIVIADLSVWTVSIDDQFQTTSWRAGDNLAFVDGPFLDSFLNTRTGETAGVRFQEIGTRLTIASFQEREFRSRLVSFDDGTTWGIFFDDENESRTWRVGEDVVLYDNGFFHEAINLSTGRVIALDSTP